MKIQDIKFRAWDLILNSMIYGINPYSLSSQNFEIMQFTCLKDSKGVDIYEGDILKIKLPAGGFWGNIKMDKIGVVRYESDYGGYIVEWEYSKNQHHEKLNCDIAYESVIISNIYENPLYKN